MDGRKNSKFEFKEVTYWLLSYCFLVLCTGYTYCSGDQTEFLPLVFNRQDPTLMTRDFFVTQYLVNGHGVRDGVTRLIYKLSEIMPLNWALFLSHFMAGIVMISGCFSVLKQILTKDLEIILISVCVALGLLYEYNVGGNELYYPALLPSLLSKCFLVWAFYFALKDRHLLWPLFVAAGAFFQFLAALQVLILLSGMLYLRIPGFLTQKFNFNTQKSWLFLTIMSLVIAIVGIYLGQDILYHKNHDFEDILLWRVGHHYDPEQFSKNGVLIFCLIAVPGIYLWYRKEKNVFKIFLLALTGCLIYIMLYKSMPVIILTQWFKTTIWVKWLSVSILVWFILAFIKRHIVRQKLLNVKAGMLTIVLFAGIYKGPLTGVDFQWPWIREMAVDEIRIARSAERLTSKDALFLIPLENTTFKIWSKRSCYVDYKSTVFDRNGLSQWYQRIHDVYDIGLNDALKANKVTTGRSGYLETLKDRQWLTAQEISHFIIDEPMPQYHLLDRKGRWHLYGLK